ncbi:Down syndrome cell adhesion molecule-like protein Dscam2 isoform X2 [Centruroides sculpturatus]|uniref:Down syndrome cell adhesion molecule-like protein Dscam2 isoform X3 n=1 Tax=Centruroides sculpturatus TaxID=218467 RepID=UPI000C6CCD8C|nr:Down syndrome cell adhesion molecule-like protein Dscam2 isoform X3 [Centruroides sculpturatus]XP_023225145.1 Down syndrome cell adhesion molecule-like protein Dscam2 isoform X2 [Centruroides sculpturatus]
MLISEMKVCVIVTISKLNYASNAKMALLFPVISFVFFDQLLQSLSEQLPQIQPITFPKQVILGQKISTVCSAISGNSPLTFSWLKDGREINDNDEISIQSFKDYSVLFIEKVKVQSAGNYTCVLSTSAGVDKYTATLEVQAPSAWIKQPKDADVIVGSILVLECEATGLPLPTITWTKLFNLKGAFPDQKEPKLGKNELVLESIRDVDEGEYVCEAKNGIGDALIQKVTVNVRGDFV